MKTTEEILEEYDSISYGWNHEDKKAIDIKNVQEAMIEYGKQLLIEAADKGYALIKDHDGYTREYVTGDYSTEIDMSENSPLKYGCSVIFEKDSILNIINELK